MNHSELHNLAHEMVDILEDSTGAALEQAGIRKRLAAHFTDQQVDVLYDCLYGAVNQGAVNGCLTALATFTKIAPEHKADLMGFCTEVVRVIENKCGGLPEFN